MWQTQHLPVTWSKYQCFLQAKTVWSECWTMRNTHPTCLYTGDTCFMTSPKFLFSGFLSNPAENIRLKSFSKNGGSGPVGSSDTLSWKLGWENIIATDNMSEHMNINSQHHWVLGPELSDIFGFKGLMEFVKSHSGRSSRVFLMCKVNPDCFAVSNLPVQWLWLGLCTSAGMRWGCVAQRWLRRLRIVEPEEQLVTWR